MSSWFMWAVSPLGAAVSTTAGVIAEETGAFATSDTAANMDALNRYITTEASINTSEAEQLRDDWINWWNGLGWWQKSGDQETFDEARNKINAFNRANAPTAEDRANVERIIREGVTAEESRGEARRALSTGDFPKKPFELVPPWVKIGLGVSLLVGVGLGIASMVAKLNPASLLLAAKEKFK